MKIVKADIDDAKDILELQKIAYQSEAEIYNDFDIPPLTQTLEEIKRQFGDHIFLKTVENKNIIGSVRAYEKDGTCFIGRLIVHPEKQNQGIGTVLTNEIERCFNGVQRYELFTGSESTKNIHLYEKLGYHIFESEKLSEVVKLVYMEKKI